jgi:phosphatidylserine decarboxylase
LIIRYISLLFLISSFGIHAQDHISVSNVWIATAPASVSTHAGYLIIQNHGQNQVNLVSVSSPYFAKVEIHKTVTENTVTRMQRFEKLEIPAGGQLELSPGDFHLMLYNADENLKTGSSVPLLFEFSDNTILETTAQVRNMTDLFQQVPDDQPPPPESENFSGLKVFYQNLIPQHFLSGLMYRLTRSDWSPFKNFIITSFINFFDVDMSIAKQAEPREYENFNAFFTRQLKPGARPLATGTSSVISPIDGSVSQFGHIIGDSLLQAKGRNFSLTALLGGDKVLASRFTNGDFITLYLAPRDYHRIHMPIDGELRSMIYVPGKLFSVDPATTRGIDNLFARNERVINIFTTEIGSMALIMVGAIFVGSMETVWAGEITPASIRKQSITNYPETDEVINLSRGEEVGRFNMGSTVILLFEQGKIKWDPQIAANAGMIMGQKIAEVRGQQQKP